ncbi:hypothetical protein CANARDRAFT_27867 [[Candida] arabinofermentans NRRL YB-2248]|uniref:Ribosome biogenesis protein ALB1 n=1 Tax=[Candida] arabinofermentans NRRL YB-2248 TaxID=983967 RepID=A0A1E4T211_9ASCO|nr:hypothetical protein CANARDRAFT_27867 [[Candida] arabinofermentans NRRL YB-2248]
MPSKNSINKPKDNIIRQRKSLRRSSVRPVSKDRVESSDKPVKSTALAVYSGATLRSAKNLVQHTLSNKRAKKIERNQKYASARKLNTDQLLVDLAAQQEGSMDIDLEGKPETTSKKSSKIQEGVVRNALWAVVEDAAAGTFNVTVSGDGTTLGGPSF